MKRIILFLLLCLFFACDNNKYPSDLNIEYNCYAYKINTFDSIYFRHYENKDTAFKFSLTTKENHYLFNLMLKMDLFNYPKIITSTPSSINQRFLPHQDSIKIRAYGKMYVFYWDLSNNYWTSNLNELERQLKIIVNKKEGIKSLPPGRWFR